MSMSKSERKRRAHVERNRKYRERQKSREAALKAAQAQQWALQRQKEQAAKEAEQKEATAAEAARIAALPKPTCLFHECQEPSCNNPKGRQLCPAHYDLLYPPAAIDLDGAPEVTRAQVREYNRRRTEAENPFIWKPAPIHATAQDWTVALLGQTAPGRPAGTYSESTGWHAAEDPAETAAREARIRLARANRTWTQNDLVQFEIDVRQQMKERTDETTDY